MSSNLVPSEDGILPSPPFVQVEGVINIRDIGGYPIEKSSRQYVKPRIVYRSGELNRITDTGKSQLNALVGTVFDLRSGGEISTSTSPLADVEGISVIRAPLSEKAYDPVSLQAKYIRTSLPCPK